MIPGLQNAVFHKLGSIHRNLFINTPTVLNANLSSKKDSDLYFAGQITGVEGYFESTCTGLLVAKFLTDRFEDRRFSPPPLASAFGALWGAITNPDRALHFQPTNINWGLFPGIEILEKDKQAKKEKILHRAIESFAAWTI